MVTGKTRRDLPLFPGASAEQVHRLTGVCGVAGFAAGEVIYREGQAGAAMYVVLRGEVAIELAGGPAAVGAVRAGECLGEISLLTAAPHSAPAGARPPVEVAVQGHQDLAELIRLRPDIGLHLYRNLAIGMGEKIKRAGMARSDGA
jgi:CRP-like cAMP-binding protein